MFTQTFDVWLITQRFVFLPAQSLDNLTVIPNNVCACLCVHACVCAHVRACEISLIVVCEREGRVRISTPLSVVCV